MGLTIKRWLSIRVIVLIDAVILTFPLKVLDKLQTKDKVSSLPLLNSLCGELLNQEMNFFVENIAAQAHKKHSLLIFAGFAGGSERYASQDDLASESPRQPASGTKPVGLFRGKSFMEHSLERYHAAVVR